MSEPRSIDQMSVNPAYSLHGLHSDSLLLPARACMAVVFVFSGAAKLRTAAATLAAFTFVATLVGRRFWDHQGVEFYHQLTMTLEHLAIVGGFLLLMITGPGRLSLKAMRVG